MIKVIVMVISILLLPGIVMGTISSIRAGQIDLRRVYLRSKIFAQRIFNPATNRHVRNYWQYYLLITGFILVALGY